MSEHANLMLTETDMGGLAIHDVVCVDCIEGFCPARTPSTYDGTDFILCGAKKATQPVLERYQARTGITLHIEHPC